MKIGEWVTEQIAQLAVWGGSDAFRWKMKNVGWSGWGVASAKQATEEGYEKEE